MNIILHFFYKLFRIVKVKTYVVFPDKTKREIRIKHIPDVIFFKKEGEYYNVTKVVSEIVNDILIYNWLNLEEIK